MLRLRDPHAAGEAGPEVAALLIDMDGTLVNSDAAVERAWSRWARDNGIDPEAVIAVCHGATADATITRFLPHLDDDEVTAMAREHMAIETTDTEGVVANPGARRLVAWLDEHGVPWAVVTNADRPLSEARFEAAGVPWSHLVTVEEVPVGKPDPALYLLGAERLGVDIACCLVVEDSAAGVAAGKAAGARVAALARDDGDLRIADLDELRGLLEPTGPLA